MSSRFEMSFEVILGSGNTHDRESSKVYTTCVYEIERDFRKGTRNKLTYWHAPLILTYRIFQSISHTFYPEICSKFSTCDLYCRCEKEWALPSISRMRVPTCSSWHGQQQQVRAMAMRQSSYIAVFKLEVVEYAEKHCNRRKVRAEKGYLASTTGVAGVCIK